MFVKKQDGPEGGGVSWPCFPAKHIGGNTDVGDRYSSRRPRSVRFRSQKFILFFVIRKEVKGDTGELGRMAAEVETDQCESRE